MCPSPRIAMFATAALTFGCSLAPTSSSSGLPSSVVAPSETPTAQGRVATRGAATSTNSVSIPVVFSLRPAGIAAIHQCVGENVAFSGDALLLAHQTFLADGSLMLDTVHLNSQGATATGLSTGSTYHIDGADSNEVIFSPGGTLSATIALNLLAVGPSGSGFIGHALQHITIVPDGTITALVDIASADCR